MQQGSQRASVGAGIPLDSGHGRSEVLRGIRVFMKLSRIALLALGMSAAPAHAELVDRIAAIANDDIITLSQVEERANPELAQMPQEADAAKRIAQRELVMKRALDQLISESLMNAQIKALGVEVTDNELDLSTESVKKSRSLTDEQFNAELNRAGYTMASYRKYLKSYLSRMKLVNLKVRSKIKVSDEDLKAEYAREARDSANDFEVHARHILISLNPTASEAQVQAAYQRALEITAEARKPGADFALLAKTKSDGPSAASGGDLGTFKRGVMQAEFERAAFTLPVGGVSEPVRTKFGWHVIKVMERKALAAPAFDEQKEQLRQKLQEAELEKATEQYVADLRNDAVVEVKL